MGKCEERVEFYLLDYVDSYADHPHDVHFSVPLWWLLEHPDSLYDEDGDWVGIDLDAELVYRDAVADGVYRIEEVD